MNNLQLVKSERFGEIEADIYTNGTDMFMTAAQLCNCLNEPRSTFDNRTSRNQYLKTEEFSVSLKMRGTDGKQYNTRIFNEDGIYEITMLAETPKAKEFRTWLREVVKSIRQTGFYGTPAAIDAMLSNPDTMIKMLTAYKAEKEGRAVAEATVKELTPKATYCDHMLDNPGLVPITAISKDYGMSGTAMNKLLHDFGVQYKRGSQWFLYEKYQDCGYVSGNPVPIILKDGSPDIIMQTKWTQKGRKFIYDLLKNHGIVPAVERPPFIKIKESQNKTAAMA